MAPADVRRGSRSPRQTRQHEGGESGCAAAQPGAGADSWLGSREGDLDDVEAAAEYAAENGAKSAVLSQIRLQTAYLRQFLEPPRPQSAPQNVPRELRAGLPLEAAQALLLRGRVADDHSGIVDVERPSWSGLLAHEACLAAALRLFSILTPSEVSPKLFSNYIASARFGAETKPGACIADVGQALAEAATECGLAVQAVSSAAVSLEAMVKNRPCACCCVLQAYVAVLDDAETGEEIEQDIGQHCVLVLGGDLAGGPNYVVLDPASGAAVGGGDGEVAYWSEHDLQRASPSAWIELAPPARIAA